MGRPLTLQPGFLGACPGRKGHHPLMSVERYQPQHLVSANRCPLQRLVCLLLLLAAQVEKMEGNYNLDSQDLNSLNYVQSVDGD